MIWERTRWHPSCGYLRIASCGRCGGGGDDDDGGGDDGDADADDDGDVDDENALVGDVGIDASLLWYSLVGPPVVVFSFCAYVYQS